MSDGKFKSGHPGGPGRPPGVKNKRTLVGQALDAASEDVAKRVVAEALAGDMTAARLVLERVQPPLRPQIQPVMFPLDASAPLVTQGQQVLAAVSQGLVDVDTGKILIDCLSAFAGLRQVDDLAARIAALEGRRQ